jgi:Dehydrogenase E1 component
MQSPSPNLPSDTQREMLRRMLATRRFEESASADCLASKIYGVVHCYIGEEAVAVGTALASIGEPEGYLVICGTGEFSAAARFSFLPRPARPASGRR